MEIVYKKKGRGKTREIIEAFKAAKEPKILVIKDQAEKERVRTSFFTIKEGLTFDHRYRIMTFGEFLQGEKRFGLQQETKIFIDNLDILLEYFDHRFTYFSASLTDYSED